MSVQNVEHILRSGRRSTWIQERLREDPTELYVSYMMRDAVPGRQRNTSDEGNAMCRNNPIIACGINSLTIFGTRRR